MKISVSSGWMPPNYALEPLKTLMLQMCWKSQLSVFMMCWLCRTIEDVDQLAKFKCADNVQICLTNLISHIGIILVPVDRPAEFRFL